MSTFEAVQAQYEKNKQASGNQTPKISQEDRLKKYFNTIVPKGATTVEKRIRILDTKDGSSPFVEVDFHEVIVDGKKVKLWDPAQEGKPSPLNETRKGLQLSGTENDKKLAKNYYPHKYYIVKVIDRENEADGPKFWRFKHAYKNDGTYDKIFPIFRNKQDMTDPKTGRDLILTVSLTKSNNGGEYSVISSIIPDDPSPLSTNEELAAKWSADEMVWSDVYAKKPFEYLDIVANGGNPKWNKVSGKWVSDIEEQESFSSSGTNAALVEDPQDGEQADDDLPF